MGWLNTKIPVASSGGGGGTGDVTTAQLNSAIADFLSDRGTQADLATANALSGLKDGDTARIGGVRYVYSDVASSFIESSGGNFFGVPVDVAAGNQTYAFDPNGLDGKFYLVYRIDDGAATTNTLTVDISAAANGWTFEHLGITSGQDITFDGAGESLLLAVDDTNKLVRVTEYGGTARSGGGSGGSTAGLPLTGWTTSNVNADRVFDADNSTFQETKDVLGTLIADLT